MIKLCIENLCSFNHGFAIRLKNGKTHQISINTSKKNFGNTGHRDDPIVHIDQIKGFFSDEWNTSCIRYASLPYEIDIASDIIIEKTIVYCDGNNDSIWSKGEDIIEYVLLYSNE